MRIREVVRVEANPELKTSTFNNLICIKGRVSFKTRRKHKTFQKGEAKESWYGSLFVTFIGFKDKNGNDPWWISTIVPGANLLVEGQVTSSQDKEGKTPKNSKKSN